MFAVLPLQKRIFSQPCRPKRTHSTQRTAHHAAPRHATPLDMPKMARRLAYAVECRGGRQAGRALNSPTDQRRHCLRERRVLRWWIFQVIHPRPWLPPRPLQNPSTDPTCLDGTKGGDFRRLGVALSATNRPLVRYVSRSRCCYIYCEVVWPGVAERSIGPSSVQWSMRSYQSTHGNGTWGWRISPVPPSPTPLPRHICADGVATGLRSPHLRVMSATTRSCGTIVALDCSDS